jgi:hypothetical protein
MTKCYINTTPLDVSRETLQIRMILINIEGASICIILTNVKIKIKIKLNLIYIFNSCINSND